MIKSKQKGFTLLELLVVITLLAVLSVGALVAYEGLGENASNVAAANNIKTADSAIRAYRALENVYPNQWDNLANEGGELSGGAVDTLSNATKSFFGQVAIDPANATHEAVLKSLAAVGISELQTLTAAAVLPVGLSPNEFFNESAPGVANPADEVEWIDDGEYDAPGPFSMSIVPSGSTTTACELDGADLNTNFNGAAVTELVVGNGFSHKLNRINDALDSDGCHLVVALGFGKDVPGTTLGSRVAISTAPTYTNGNIVNPSVHYARYIALFHVASAEDGEDEIEAGDVLPRARLIAVVDTEGRNIDQAIAGSFASN